MKDVLDAISFLVLQVSIFAVFGAIQLIME